MLAALASQFEKDQKARDDKRVRNSLLSLPQREFMFFFFALDAQIEAYEAGIVEIVT